MQAMDGAVQELVKHYLGTIAKASLQRRLDRSVPKVVEGMISKGMVPERAPVELLVRDALFRLWRSVIPSGDIADFIRDRQAEAVIGRVTDRIGRSLITLAIVVKATADALVETTF